jgi:hypothetical protein
LAISFARTFGAARWIGGFALGGGEAEHGAVVEHRAAVAALALGLGAQFVGVFEAGVEAAQLLQLGGGGFVAFGVVAAAEAVVPVEAEPGEVVRRAALADRLRVVDGQHEAGAEAAGFGVGGV